MAISPPALAPPDLAPKRKALRDWQGLSMPPKQPSTQTFKLRSRSTSVVLVPILQLQLVVLAVEVQRRNDGLAVHIAEPLAQVPDFKSSCNRATVRHPAGRRIGIGDGLNQFVGQN